MREALCREVERQARSAGRIPKGLESHPLPQIGEPRRHPGWGHLSPPGHQRPAKQCDSRVRTHLGHRPGSGPGLCLPFSSPKLVGLCGAWNPAVVRTCGPGELAGWGQVRVGERERGTADRPGVGLRVPVTAAVTVAVGNAFLRGRGRLLEVSREASPGAPRLSTCRNRKRDWKRGGRARGSG